MSTTDRTTMARRMPSNVASPTRNTNAGTLPAGKVMKSPPYRSSTSRTTMSVTARLEIIDERAGAPRRRSGANATRSSAMPKSPVTRTAIGRATNHGSPSVPMTNSAMNAPSMNTVG